MINTYMSIQEAMLARHSVRSYIDKPLDENARQALQEEIDHCNRLSRMHIQLVTNEPKAFEGKFAGCKNYLALIGPDTRNLPRLAGYYGEKVVLLAQMMGLNTCWVAMTYRKVPEAYEILPGEKLVMVVALGYGATQGAPHRSKPLTELASAPDPWPVWFQNGVEAAALAPTAINQQKFHFTLEGHVVTPSAGFGVYTQTDLGIACLHFELGAGNENFAWADR